jgi:hypothetical protein
VFFVDVDLPPALRGADADLPCVCFRRARGLPSRLPAQRNAEAALERALRVACAPAGGAGGTTPQQCAPHGVRVALEACADADALLDILDTLSWGGFLSRSPAWRADGASHASRGRLALGSGPGASERWVETGWLTRQGYYSLAAWIANRLEVALWGRLKAASRGGAAAGGGAVPRAPAAPPPAAVRWAAMAPAARARTEARPGGAAAASRAVADALRPLRPRGDGGNAAAFGAARGALEALINAVDSVFVPWQAAADAVETQAAAAGSAQAAAEAEGMLSRLLWQPLLVAASPSGALCARVGAACLAAADAAADADAAAAAAALLRGEAAAAHAATAEASAKADKRKRARAAARVRKAAEEDAAVAAASASIVAAALSRVLSQQQQEPHEPAPPPAARESDAKRSAKRGAALGWVPGSSAVSPIVRAPPPPPLPPPLMRETPQPPPQPVPPDAAALAAMRTVSAPAPVEPAPPHGPIGRAASVPMLVPGGGGRLHSEQRRAPLPHPPHALRPPSPLPMHPRAAQQRSLHASPMPSPPMSPRLHAGRLSGGGGGGASVPDYGEIFTSGLFWSSADLAAWPRGSRASSVSSEVRPACDATLLFRSEHVSAYPRPLTGRAGQQHDEHRQRRRLARGGGGHTSVRHILRSRRPKRRTCGRFLSSHPWRCLLRLGG